MKPKFLLRVAAGCLLFFAMGHSVGHFTRHQVTDPKAKFVQQQMSENKFDMFGQMRSYDENYTGLSLNLIFTILVLSTVVWIISAESEKQPLLIRAILIPIAICLFGFAVTSFVYFFPTPGVTCLVSALLVSATIFKLRSPV